MISISYSLSTRHLSYYRTAVLRAHRGYMYRVAEHTSLFIRGVLRGENKSYQHVVMAAQAFDFTIQMLTRDFNKSEKSRQLALHRGTGGEMSGNDVEN